jgi:hypothetical protein
MNNSDHPSCHGDEMKILPLNIDSTCCRPAQNEAQISLPSLSQRFVIGSVSTPAGRLPQVSSQLHRHDYWGTVKARWGVGRIGHTIDPGLYALGNPDNNSPVLATANYKMSFDELRKSLPGKNFWILALDTKGINVWCAAGKGTFGTNELVSRTESSGLEKIVSHRSLILPQLAGPGVAAHIVKKLSGFGVSYGPIKAADVPAYMDAGFKATPEMRLKTFTLRERVALIPVELVEAFKPSLIILPFLFLVGGIGGPSGFWANALNHGSFAVLAFLGAILGGAVIHPLLLPYLPGRAFSIKGLLIGMIMAFFLIYMKGYDFLIWPERIEALAWLLIVPAFTAYLAMNFTGCSTYTSLSGVNKEMRWALPLEVGTGVCGLVVWIASRLMT